MVTHMCSFYKVFAHRSAAMLCNELLHAPLPDCLQLRIVLHIIAQSFNREARMLCAISKYFSKANGATSPRTILYVYNQGLSPPSFMTVSTYLYSSVR